MNHATGILVNLGLDKYGEGLYLGVCCRPDGSEFSRSDESDYWGAMDFMYARGIRSWHTKQIDFEAFNAWEKQQKEQTHK